MGVDIHELRRYNGTSDHNPSCKGGAHKTRSAPSETLRKGRFTHHWTYYKARAKAIQREKKEK